MESFFHTLKTEWDMHCDYKTRDDARASLFDYKEVFYNRQRRHSSIGYEAPLPFETMQSPAKVSIVRGQDHSIPRSVHRRALGKLRADL
jgi:transposase InsO family protein